MPGPIRKEFVGIFRVQVLKKYLSKGVCEGEGGKIARGVTSDGVWGKRDTSTFPNGTAKEEVPTGKALFKLGKGQVKIFTEKQGGNQKKSISNIVVGGGASGRRRESWGKKGKSPERKEHNSSRKSSKKDATIAEEERKERRWSLRQGGSPGKVKDKTKPKQTDEKARVKPKKRGIGKRRVFVSAEGKKKKKRSAKKRGSFSRRGAVFIKKKRVPAMEKGRA